MSLNNLSHQSVNHRTTSMTLANYFEADSSPLGSLTSQFFAEIDDLNAEDYAYYLAYGEVPTAADLGDETEAA